MPAGSRQAHTIPAAASLGRPRSACPAFVRVAIAGLMVCLTGPLFAETIILDNTTSATPLDSSSTLGTTASTIQAIAFNALTNTTVRGLTVIPICVNSPITVAYTFSLYGVDANNLPTGAALASYTTSSLSVDKTAVTATKADAYGMDLTTSSTGSWSLASGVSYALAISSNNGQAGLAVINGDPSTANALYIGRDFSFNGGVSFFGPFTTATPYIKLDSAVPVPEPSTWVLGAVGIACAGWQGYRRRRAR